MVPVMGEHLCEIVVDHGYLGVDVSVVVEAIDALSVLLNQSMPNRLQPRVLITDPSLNKLIPNDFIKLRPVHGIRLLEQTNKKRKLHILHVGHNNLQSLLKFTRQEVKSSTQLILLPTVKVFGIFPCLFLVLLLCEVIVEEL